MHCRKGHIFVQECVALFGVGLDYFSDFDEGGGAGRKKVVDFAMKVWMGLQEGEVDFD